MSEKTILTYKGKEYEVVGFGTPEEGDYYITPSGKVINSVRTRRNIQRTIVKPLKWKPKRGEGYYTPDQFHKTGYSQWDGCEIDETVYENGLVCRTEEDALELYEKITEFTKNLQLTN